MILSVLEGLDVLDMAMALQAAVGSVRKTKMYLKRAVKEAQSEEGKEILRLMLMKLTQMEDQRD